MTAPRDVILVIISLKCDVPKSREDSTVYLIALSRLLPLGSHGIPKVSTSITHSEFAGINWSINRVLGHPKGDNSRRRVVTIIGVMKS